MSRVLPMLTYLEVEASVSMSRVLPMFTYLEAGASVSYVSRILPMFTYLEVGASMSYVRSSALVYLSRSGGISVLCLEFCPWLLI